MIALVVVGNATTTAAILTGTCGPAMLMSITVPGCRWLLLRNWRVAMPGTTGIRRVHGEREQAGERVRRGVVQLAGVGAEAGVEAETLRRRRPAIRRHGGWAPALPPLVVRR